MHELSRVAVSRVYFLVAMGGLLIAVASLSCCGAQALGCVGFSSCGEWV